MGIKREQVEIKRKLTTIRWNMQSPGKPSLDGMPPGSGGDDALTVQIAAVDELEKLYQESEAALIQAQIDIEQMIMELESPIERQVLRYRYLDGMKWEKISVKMNYSESHIHRFYSRALRKLEKTKDESK